MDYGYCNGLFSHFNNYKNISNKNSPWIPSITLGCFEKLGRVWKVK